MKAEIISRVKAVASRLIDQEKARVLVSPYEDGPGFWFGGGNMAEDAEGSLYIVGRYRNTGDSRTGLEMGDRGLKLQILRSTDRGESFTPLISFTKEELSRPSRRVLSIEGAALYMTGRGVELYVSTEKSGVSYPESVSTYQKAGTGVWSIDLLQAPAVTALKEARLQPLLSSAAPEYLHIKDPVVHQNAAGGTILVFCHHPFNWSSSNSGYCVRGAGGSWGSELNFSFFPRGTTWDVAVSRITDILSLPGALLGSPEAVQAVFYDGAECMRAHDQNPMGVRRPRGYSCEEIAGLAVYSGEDLPSIRRISSSFPFFTSPWGTGSCRYIHTHASKDGVYATWQQSQPSGAQPLVMHYQSWEELHEAARQG